MFFFHFNFLNGCVYVYIFLIYLIKFYVSNCNIANFTHVIFTNKSIELNEFLFKYLIKDISVKNIQNIQSNLKKFTFTINLQFTITIKLLFQNSCLLIDNTFIHTINF